MCQSFFFRKQLYFCLHYLAQILYYSCQEGWETLKDHPILYIGPAI